MSSIVHTKVTAPEPGANLQVLRAVATFELAKGMIVLLAACGILLPMVYSDFFISAPTTTLPRPF
jgi:hypothetical protein